jgi:hypothetical protein
MGEPVLDGNENGNGNGGGPVIALVVVPARTRLWVILVLAVLVKGKFEASLKQGKSTLDSNRTRTSAPYPHPLLCA